MTITFEKFNTDLAGLAWKFEVNPESCENPDHYETYLRLIALSDQKIGQATTHVLLDVDEDGEKHIAGFITLRSAALVEIIGTDTYGYPALEVSQLAISQKYERKKFGTELLEIALAFANEINEKRMGVKYVILRSDPASAGFYEKFGFKRLDQFSRVPVDGYNNHCVPMIIQISF